MLLYHGSHTIVTNPNLKHCRNNTDFGLGFYLTSSFEQAKKWAKIQAYRKNFNTAHVSVFKLDGNKLGDLNIYKFVGATEEWLDFVVENRRSSTLVHKYDIVEGPVANDKLYTTISLYEQGILSAAACIENLQTHKLFDQLSFNTSKSLSLLGYIEQIDINLEAV